MKFGDSINHIMSRAGVVRVQNAPNPFLWTIPGGLVGLIICLSASYFFRDLEYILVVFGLIFAGIPLLVTLVAGFILLFRDPDRLQSEQYLLRKQLTMMIYKKNTDGNIEIINSQSENVPKIGSNYRENSV